MRGLPLFALVLVLYGCAGPSKPEAPAHAAPPLSAEQPPEVTPVPRRVNPKSAQAHSIKHNLDKAQKGLDRARSVNERRSYILDTRDEKTLK